MSETLCTLFPLEDVTPDLISYIIGITNLKPVHRLKCSESVKEEIKHFQDTVRKFSIQKLHKAIRGQNNLRFLCQHVVENSEDKKVQALRDLLT